MYEEYAVVCAQLKEIEEKKKALAKQIVEKMSLEHIDKIESPLGKFKLTMLKNWTYPDHILELAEQVKTEKAKAESTGDATYEEVPSLRFSPDSSI